MSTLRARAILVVGVFLFSGLFAGSAHSKLSQKEMEYQFQKAARTKIKSYLKKQGVELSSYNEIKLTDPQYPDKLTKKANNRASFQFEVVLAQGSVKGKTDVNWDRSFFDGDKKEVIYLLTAVEVRLSQVPPQIKKQMDRHAKMTEQRKQNKAAGEAAFRGAVAKALGLSGMSVQPGQLRVKPVDKYDSSLKRYQLKFKAKDKGFRVKGKGEISLSYDAHGNLNKMTAQNIAYKKRARFKTLLRRMIPRRGK